MAPDKTDSSGKVCHNDQTNHTSQKGKLLLWPLPCPNAAKLRRKGVGIGPEQANPKHPGILNRPAQNTWKKVRLAQEV